VFAALVFALAFERVLAEDRPRGVHHHQDAARRHRRGGDERAQQAGGRQRDGDGVVGERPAEVLADAPARDADEEEGFEHALEALAGDDDVGGLGGQRGGRAEGDAEVGLGQRRRVVAAVADHGDAALRFEPADDGGLGLGRHAGVHFVDMLAVAVGMLGAGEQHDAAVAAQRLDDTVPGRARAVAREDGAFGGAVPADVGDDGFAMAALLGAGGERLGHRPAERGEQRAAADGDALAADRGDGAAPRVELDLAGAAAGVEPGDGARHRVRRVPLDGGGAGGELGRADHLDHRHLAAGERAGLVEGDDVDARRLLEEVGAGDDDAAAQRGADRGRGGERDGQAEGARAGDDERGERGQQRLLRPRAGEQKA